MGVNRVVYNLMDHSAYYQTITYVLTAGINQYPILTSVVTPNLQPTSRCFKTKSSSYSGVKSVRFESANSAPCPVMGPPSLDRTASLYTYPGARRHCRCRY